MLSHPDAGMLTIAEPYGTFNMSKCVRAARDGTHEKTEPMRPPRSTISHLCGFDVGVYTSALVEETNESVWDRKPLGSEDSRYARCYRVLQSCASGKKRGTHLRKPLDDPREEWKRDGER